MSPCTAWIRRIWPSSQDQGPTVSQHSMWRTKAGGAARSPILGNGTLFIGSDDGFLYGLDARTGKDRWRLDLGGIANVPVYGDGVVAAADRNGTLHGVDAVTGAERWHTDPVLNGGLPVLASGVVYATGNDHEAHGFDLQTGAERWAWNAPADLGGAPRSCGGHCVSRVDGRCDPRGGA